MRIHLFASCRNEAEMLPFFLRHYEPLVDRIFVYDDGSDDGSLDLLRAAPKVSAFHTGTPPGSDDPAARDWLDNHCWQRSRGAADWVIVAGVDEHLDHPAGLRRYLAACRRAGITVVPAAGYDMVYNEQNAAAGDLPGPGATLRREIRWGRPAPDLARISAFAPDRIADMGYAHGRRQACPTGEIRLPSETTLRLLRYRPGNFPGGPSGDTVEVVPPATAPLLRALMRSVRRLAPPVAVDWTPGTPIGLAD